MIKRIDKQTFLEFLTNEEIQDEVINYLGEHLLINPPDIPHYGYFHNEVLIAVCSIHNYLIETTGEFEIEISNCFTHPNYRKLGAFTAFINKAKEIANVMQVDLTCRAYIDTSYPIFKKEGFIEVGKPLIEMKFSYIND